MGDPQRLEELRHRVQRDPASLAFAQLAEECRRAGQFEEAVRVCREGLTHHPDYLSARVTLGRALIGLEQFEEGAAELSAVLHVAPENLAALHGLAEAAAAQPSREAQSEVGPSQGVPTTAPIGASRALPRLERWLLAIEARRGRDATGGPTS